MTSVTFDKQSNGRRIEVEMLVEITVLLVQCFDAAIPRGLFNTSLACRKPKLQ